jgi:cobyrinic acid a,c-diamide synthase
MAGILGSHSRMTEKLQALGYTEGKTILDTPVAKKGTLIKGHEFHYSITQCDSDARLAYRLSQGKGIQEGKDGLVEHNTIASYMHSHPASLSLETFINACEKYRRS